MQGSKHLYHERIRSFDLHVRHDVACRLKYLTKVRILIFDSLEYV